MRPVLWTKVGLPLRERDFRLLWSGRFVSGLGDGVFTVAVALEALRVDPQPVGLAYVLAARAVPSVALSLLGGVVVDRVPRRMALILCDLVPGAAVSAVALLALLQLISLWQMILMALIFGTADAFSGPAFLALVPEILPTAALARANALNSASNELTVNLIGPALGGLAVALVGTVGAFGFDTATFLISATSLGALRHRATTFSRGKSMVAEAREGIRFITSRRWLFLLLSGAAIANLVGMGPYFVLLPVLVRHVLHATPLALGLVYASAGAAGVVASLVVARLGSPKHLLEVMWMAYSSSGVLLALVAFAPNPGLVALLIAGSAGLVVYGDVLYFTKLQTSVPLALMGRVSSVSYVMVGTLTPLGMLLGGVAAATVGAREAFLLSGVLSALCGLVLLIPGARVLDQVPSPA